MTTQREVIALYGSAGRIGEDAPAAAHRDAPVRALARRRREDRAGKRDAGGPPQHLLDAAPIGRMPQLDMVREGIAGPRPKTFGDGSGRCAFIADAPA